MKGHILIGGIVGQSEFLGFTGVTPTGGYFGPANNMGCIGTIIHM